MATVVNAAFPAATSDSLDGNVSIPKSEPDPTIHTYDTDGTTNIDANADAATGSVELTGGAAGSVDDITVNGVSIMSGAEAFDTDLDTTAAAVADNIAANTSDPNYTASATGAVITITAVTKGDSVNEFAVVSSTTTITSEDTDMSGGQTHLINDPNKPTITYQ